MALDVTAMVLTLNEELNLPECLESLRPLGCDVIVVDSGSTDRTREIAEKAGARVYEHPFRDYGDQRNWAQDSLPIESRWVLHLDADERLTPELAAGIGRALTSPSDDTNGYLLRRRTVFLGRWIRHGGHYPSYHARLFRKDKGRCEDRLYDQHYVVQGRVERLAGDILDVTSELAPWAVRHAGWARMEAAELMRSQDRPGLLKGRLFGTPIERRRWLRQSLYRRLPLFIRPFLYFGYRYFLRLGFLDGKRGLVFHFLQGCWYRFQVDAFILESRLSRGEGEPPADPESRPGG